MFTIELADIGSTPATHILYVVDMTILCYIMDLFLFIQIIHVFLDLKESSNKYFQIQKYKKTSINRKRIPSSCPITVSSIKIAGKFPKKKNSEFTVPKS